MRSNITLEISPKQVITLVERLPIMEKLRLIRQLEKETWGNKLDSVTQRMRSRIKKEKISVKNIDRICEEVKREYDEKHRSH